MSNNFVAKTEITIAAPVSDVWSALTDPAKIKEYMFGAQVVTNWKKGSPIVWRGEWQGNAYEDKGRVITFEPEKKLVVTHWSPMSGVPDLPENRHTVSYELHFKNGTTHVVLTQDNNASEDEKKHSEWTWNMMLQNLKGSVEK
jgi:uncharacterized protein YndB with AHSA1/START domain